MLAEASALDTDLSGAACRGRQPAFDAEVYGETADAALARVAAAIEICRDCPVIAACDNARSALPARHVTGVWAGRLYGRLLPL
ncbi:MAG: WhiB family transcriptional regulator [Rhodococcus sp. (in: high G+C Gram-positive bacteria)]